MLRRPRPFDHGFVTEHYDVTIAGGGTPARALALPGKRMMS